MESLESVHGSAFGNLPVLLQTVRSGCLCLSILLNDYKTMQRGVGN